MQFSSIGIGITSPAAGLLAIGTVTPTAIGHIGMDVSGRPLVFVGGVSSKLAIQSELPLAQTLFVELTADTTTASTVFVDVTNLTLTITPKVGSKVVVHFTASLSNTTANTNNQFQLLVDGAVKRGCATDYVATPGACVGITYVVTGLTAAAHVIKLQWKTSAGTLQIRPVTTVAEHASLLLQEVLV